MRRVLIIGDPESGGLRTAVAAGFRAQSWAVQLLDFAVTGSRVSRAISHRWQAASVLRRRRLHAELAEQGPADLVLVIKGQFLSPDDVTRMGRTFRVPVLCWNPDDPTDFALSNSGAGIPAAMPAYDAYVTWSPVVARRLAGRTRRVLSVPFGWDDSTHYPCPGITPTSDIVFVGTRTVEREAWMRTIADLRPIVYGNGWAPIPGVTIRPPVSGPRLRELVGSSRAMLNFLRPQNADTHNMRTFELPGCGGMQVAEYSTEHARMLRDCHLFRDASELRAILIEEHLGPLGFAPLWLHEHTYANRVGQLLAQV